jgi:hypothetical protein
VEHLKNQGSADGAKQALETEEFGRSIYARHMGVVLVSPRTQGAGEPSAILRFGMERFALADSVQRRWAVGSPLAYDRASLKHLAVFGTRNTLPHEGSVKQHLAPRVLGAENSPPVEVESPVRMKQRMEKNYERPMDQVKTTRAGSATSLLQAKSVAPTGPGRSAVSAVIASANPVSNTAAAPHAHSGETAARDLARAIPSTVTPLSEITHASTERPLMLKSSATEPAVWGPIIRQRPRGAVQPEPVVKGSSPVSPTSVPDTQAAAAKIDSGPSSAVSPVHSPQTESGIPNSVQVPVVKPLCAPVFGSAIVSRHGKVPFAVLRHASTSLSGDTNHVVETGSSAYDPQSSSRSNSLPIVRATTGTRDGNISGRILRKNNQDEATSASQTLPTNAGLPTERPQSRPSADTTESQSHSPHHSRVTSDPIIAESAVAPSPATYSGHLDSGTANLPPHAPSPLPLVAERCRPSVATIGEFSTDILHRQQNSAVARSTDAQSTIRLLRGSRDASLIQRSPVGSGGDGREVIVQPTSDQSVPRPTFTHSDFASPPGTAGPFRKESGRPSTETDDASGQGFGETVVTGRQMLAFSHNAPAAAVSPIGRPFEYATAHVPTVGGRLLRKTAPGEAVRPTNAPQNWSPPGSIARISHTLALTHRIAPALNAAPIFPRDIRPAASVPDFSARLQRAVVPAGGETTTTPTESHMSLPEQGGALSRTPPAVDVASLANRVYDLLVRRLASERQRRGL